ncbi:FMN-binding negative transcriptional regulator [Naasia lichenicola]|uniref:FMN-binding negative transcriptional regulator n=1 Tax=Naasia lichenicola TaxID=2565933 RepID=A0A4S4FEQ7_9MICO|nr:FMN-binding negative transcriptional regulator [Naasia lichenicola]THG28649.1 FMN-binding negative transcriptional regulator [Naasia lichenicola]
MRQNPSFVLQDQVELKRLIRENPWAILISTTDDGMVASHYPIVLEEDEESISVVSHVGRPDEQLHGLGEREVLLIVQGPHGYISPGWYTDPDGSHRPNVPTWNYVTAHLYGVPEILSDEENYRVLGDLVEHFERVLPEPRLMEITPENAQYAQRISSGTVGFRLRPTRVVAKSKLSQNRPDHIVDTVIGELEGSGPYAQPALAAEMRRVHERRRAARG